MNKSKGLGDTVKKIIKNLGINKLVKENCKPCEKRIKKLNEKFPYK